MRTDVDREREREAQQERSKAEIINYFRYDIGILSVACGNTRGKLMAQVKVDCCTNVTITIEYKQEVVDYIASRHHYFADL